MSEFIQPFDLQQYKKIMQISAASFMLFLAGCGAITIPKNIDAVNAKSETPILSPSETNCGDEDLPLDVVQARQNDAIYMEEQLKLSREQIKQEMASFCNGLIPPTP
jgi:hypothetical protein